MAAFLTRIYKVAYSPALTPSLLCASVITVIFSAYQAKRSWHVIFFLLSPLALQVHHNVLQNLPVKCFFQQSKGNEKDLPLLFSPML